MVEVTNIQQPLNDQSHANQNKADSNSYNSASEFVMSAVEELQNVSPAS